MDRHQKKRLNYQKALLTYQRMARLGFLIGVGWDAKSIAEDPIIACTRSNVLRMARKYGLFDSLTLGSLHDSRFSDVFRKAADKRGLSRYDLIRRILTEIAEEPYLLENILDDGA